MNTPNPPSPEEAAALGRTLTRTLAVAATMAGIFTAVNTTLFAVRHGTPWAIAILLDPMLATGLVTILLADARLASWGARPPGWSAVLRWFTGVTATVLNTWHCLWPDDRPGWPSHADIAGVALHAVPPVLLALLAETVASYRDRLHHLTATATSPHPDHTPETRSSPDGDATTGDATIVPRDEIHTHLHPGREPSSLVATSPEKTNTPADEPRTTADDHPARPAAPTPARPGCVPAIDSAGDGGTHHGPCPVHSGPNTTPSGHAPQPRDDGPSDGDVFTRALRLDEDHQARTGRPIPVNTLRTTLGIGYPRAKNLRDRLDAARPEAVSPPSPTTPRTPSRPAPASMERRPSSRQSRPSRDTRTTEPSPRPS